MTHQENPSNMTPTYFHLDFLGPWPFFGLLLEQAVAIRKYAPPTAGLQRFSDRILLTEVTENRVSEFPGTTLSSASRPELSFAHAHQVFDPFHWDSIEKFLDTMTGAATRWRRYDKIYYRHSRGNDMVSRLSKHNGSRRIHRPWQVLNADSRRIAFEFSRGMPQIG